MKKIILLLLSFGLVSCGGVGSLTANSSSLETTLSKEESSINSDSSFESTLDEISSIDTRYEESIDIPTSPEIEPLPKITTLSSLVRISSYFVKIEYKGEIEEIYQTDKNGDSWVVVHNRLFKDTRDILKEGKLSRNLEDYELSYYKYDKEESGSKLGRQIQGTELVEVYEDLHSETNGKPINILVKASGRARVGLGEGNSFSAGYNSSASLGYISFNYIEGMCKAIFELGSQEVTYSIGGNEDDSVPTQDEYVSLVDNFEDFDAKLTFELDYQYIEKDK